MTQAGIPLGQLCLKRLPSPSRNLAVCCVGGIQRDAIFTYAKDRSRHELIALMLLVSLQSSPITKSSFSLQRVRHLPLFHCVANTNAWPQSHASPANEALCQRSARCSSWPGVTTNSQLSKTQHISALYQGISLRTHRVTHRVTHLCSSPLQTKCIQMLATSSSWVLGLAHFNSSRSYLSWKLRDSGGKYVYFKSKSSLSRFPSQYTWSRSTFTWSGSHQSTATRAVFCHILPCLALHTASAAQLARAEPPPRSGTYHGLPYHGHRIRHQLWHGQIWQMESSLLGQ